MISYMIILKQDTIFNYMDAPPNNIPGQSRVVNNTIDNSGNKISISTPRDTHNLDVSGNSVINRDNIIEVNQASTSGGGTSQTTTNNNYIGSINITNINNVSGAQPSPDSNFVTIPLPSSSSSAVPLINDSVVPPYVGNTTASFGDILGYKAYDDNIVPPYSETNASVEDKKIKSLSQILQVILLRRVYKYYPLNRKVIKLSHVNLAEDIRDAYYNRVGFTKIIDEITGSIIYQFKHYISIIFPDINHGYKGDGAITRYYNKDDYNIILHKKNKLYIKRIDNFLNTDYDFRINQGWRHVRGTIADKFTTYNENSFLYKDRTLEFLTDSKYIICLHLSKETNPNLNMNKFLWMLRLHRQPLNYLILGNASSHKVNLIAFLKESFDVSLYKYYLQTK